MKIKIGLFVCLLGVLVGCSNDESQGPIGNSDLFESVELEINALSYAPLTAELKLKTREVVGVEIVVLGKNGSASNISNRFSERSTNFTLDILGLYADYLNEVEVRLLDGNGNPLESRIFEIQTSPLILDLPEIAIDVQSNATTAQLNLVNYFGFNEDFRPQRPFIFDQFGDIRWYLDYSNHPLLSELFYDNGMTQLENGNLLFGDGSTGSLYEVDFAGRILNSWSLQGYGFHHHVIEKLTGNFLVTVNDPSKTTVEDVVLEIDRQSGQINTIWDLNDSLDNTRRAWPTDLADLNIDWFHANAIDYDASDDTIVVSGRTQGIVKLNSENEVSYILAPHRGWSTSGNSIDLKQFLLTPLDANNQPITDSEVLDGNVNHPDFEWSWYQHSPIFLPNGNLMVFDNGDNRNYFNAGPYSRAVEYEIDEANKTIKQVWSYGKERGEETYSRIVSKVSYVASNNSVLFTPGAATNAGVPAGKVVEIDHATKNVLFEATISPPNAIFNITFHNVLRVNFYN